MSPEVPEDNGVIPTNFEDILEIEGGMLDVDTIDRDDLDYYKTVARLTGIGFRVVAGPGQVYLKRGENAYTVGDTSSSEVSYTGVFDAELSEPVLDHEVAVSIEKSKDPAKKIAHVRFWQFIVELQRIK